MFSGYWVWDLPHISLAALAVVGVLSVMFWLVWARWMAEREPAPTAGPSAGGREFGWAEADFGTVPGWRPYVGVAEVRR